MAAKGRYVNNYLDHFKYEPDKPSPDVMVGLKEGAQIPEKFIWVSYEEWQFLKNWYAGNKRNSGMA